MTSSDYSAASWACDKLISHGEIIKAVPIEDHLITLHVKECEREIIVAVMSQKQVYLTNIPAACQNSRVHFLLNIPRNAYFDGSVLSYAASVPFGVGGLGDLYTAANEKEFREYLPKETRFILRGLRQHAAVSSVTRLNNRLYLVNRFSGKPLRVLALNDYDLTADAIRTGIDVYGKCDFILASNPNCRLSCESINAARSAETAVLKWAQFLGAINSA
ncbi:hypothetical protein [Methylocaldum sp. 14B]|jgi:hypothetical protein|uniref:hypothetical protein n=1 Tax=Methylocaldum sp. 14B TaxID=1912213 RepID=UPI00117CDC42|nr:hypothetical protein [Methylocaldum sp. 14B]